MKKAPKGGKMDDRKTSEKPGSDTFKKGGRTPKTMGGKPGRY